MAFFYQRVNYFVKLESTYVPTVSEYPYSKSEYKGGYTNLSTMLGTGKGGGLVKWLPSQRKTKTTTKLEYAQ